jgi:hypothetical protein
LGAGGLLRGKKCSIAFDQRLSADDLPLPKLVRRQIPTVLSPEEVTRMIRAEPAPPRRF